MAWIRNRKQQLSERTDFGVDSTSNGQGGNGRAQVDVVDTQAATEDWFHSLKRELHQQVIGKMDLSAMGTMGEDDLRLEVRRQAETLCRRRADLLSLDERERLVNEVLDETFGLGPLEVLMRDPDVSDILINGPKTVYIEKKGRLTKSKVAFHDANHVLQIVQRIVAGMGRRVDETCPMVDARLPDGSRLNAIIHPLALDGPLVSIRRFGAKPLLVKDLLANNSITDEMLKFLSACVEARINILISGGTGSGKTTLLNALSSYIPAEERVATIQVSRLMGGVRKIVKISEITGMEGDIISMHDIFEYKQTGLDENRAAQGFFQTTGIRPQLLGKLEACGTALPVEMFERKILGV